MRRHKDRLIVLNTTDSFTLKWVQREWICLRERGRGGEGERERGRGGEGEGERGGEGGRKIGEKACSCVKCTYFTFAGFSDIA